MLPYSLIDFEIQTNDKNKPKFKGDYLRNNLRKRKYWTYVMNLVE